MTNSDDSKKSSLKGVFDDDEFEKLQSDFNNLKTSAGSIFNTVYNASSSKVTQAIEDHRQQWDKVVKEVHERNEKRAAELKANQLNSTADVYSVEKTSEFEYPQVYETRESRRRKWCHRSDRYDAEAEATPRLTGSFHHGHFGGAGWGGLGFNDFFENFSGSRHQGKTPFGYYSRAQPSLNYYSDCMTKQGESVYDANGHWKCLFPNSQVPVKFLSYKEKNFPNAVLTKEDFERSTISVDNNGAYDLGDNGVYFKKFDDFMNWKALMHENVRQSRRFKRRNQDVVTASPREAPVAVVDREAFPLQTKDAVSAQPQERVVSTSVESSYKTNPQTNEIEWNEVRTKYLEDGSSITKTISKRRPAGEDKWVNVVEDLKHDKANTDQKGWFWRSKKD